MKYQSRYSRDIGASGASSEGVRRGQKGSEGVRRGQKGSEGVRRGQKG